MCGIVGFIGKQKEHDTVEKMLEVQAYRGPDDRGVHIAHLHGRYIHLGHNRLSIQDLSSQGHQPFVSACGEYTIVYNGEVYNFKNIRKELESLGHDFISHSDTEVILYAYKQWGIACLEKFIGMFAFSLVDKIEGKVFLVRDRAGVKPLYYYVQEEVFLFSSELKSFHEHPSFKKELNKEVLPYYFQFGYIPSPHSIFKNTYKLKPGHYLELDIASLNFEMTEYWSVNACYEEEKFSKSEAETLFELENLLTDAAEQRMVSDVPVGVFLSGGYDSSLVTALLAKNQNRKLHTYTIGFENKKYNEAEHAKAIANHLGTVHTEYYVTEKEMLEKVKTLAVFYDEPFGDSSAIPTMIVSELAKKDVTVALSADGGDEVFCGYSKYFFLQRYEDIFVKPFKKQLLERLTSVVGEKQVEMMNALLPSRVRQTNIRDKYNKFKRAIHSHSLGEMFCNGSSYVESEKVQQFLEVPKNENLCSFFQMDDSQDFLDEMMRIDYGSFMVDDVLTKVDRATMSVSLEGREPLLDHRIVEFMARVPSQMKYKHKQGKYLGRQILYKYIPKEMIDKPKAGFQIPLQEWLQGALKPLVEQYLDPQRMDANLFNLIEVEKMKTSVYNGKSEYVNAVWFLLMFEIWKEKWFA